MVQVGNSENQEQKNRGRPKGSKNRLQGPRRKAKRRLVKKPKQEKPKKKKLMVKEPFGTMDDTGVIEVSNLFRYDRELRKNKDPYEFHYWLIKQPDWTEEEVNQTQNIVDTYFEVVSRFWPYDEQNFVWNKHRGPEQLARTYRAAACLAKHGAPPEDVKAVIESFAYHKRRKEYGWWTIDMWSLESAWNNSIKFLYRYARELEVGRLHWSKARKFIADRLDIEVAGKIIPTVPFFFPYVTPEDWTEHIRNTEEDNDICERQ